MVSDSSPGNAVVMDAAAEAAAMSAGMPLPEVEEESSCNVATLSAVIFALYVVYYMLFEVKKPIVACNSRMKEYLYSHCPILSETFWPTIWCIEARCQTIMRSLLQSSPPVPYEREMLLMPDGGELGLDWIHTHEENLDVDNPTRPVVLVLPGLTGDSTVSYAKHFVLEGAKLGYRCVVLNYRGNGGTKLKTSRTYSATYTDDVDFVLSSIAQTYPHAPRMVVGVSLGGIILTNYLARKGKDARITAAMSVSAPWNMFGSCTSLEQPLNAVVFNNYLCRGLKQSVKSHQHLFEDKCNMPHVFDSRTIREFDDRFTSKMFGYKNWEEYYNDANIDQKVLDIKVPMLCLNAEDDPFSPGPFLPLDLASDESSHVAIVVTSRGGHIAFYDGFFRPSNVCYMQRLFTQFASAVFNNPKPLFNEADHFEDKSNMAELSDSSSITTIPACECTGPLEGQPRGCTQQPFSGGCEEL